MISESELAGLVPDQLRPRSAKIILDALEVKVDIGFHDYEIGVPQRLLVTVEVEGIGQLSTIGMSFVLALVMGFGAGYWLDRTLGTQPWLSFIGFMTISFHCAPRGRRACKRLPTRNNARDGCRVG